jgi:DNA-binding NtrC family response regulator
LLNVSKGLICIIDDDFDIADLFCDALNDIQGLVVLKFTDPYIALEHFKINMKDYAVVISDLRMPVINGLQLLKTVKDLNPTTRTILMTAFDVQDEVFEEYTKNNIINGFLQKPIELKLLVDEVNKQMIGSEIVV